MVKYGIGIDLGGTKLSAALMDENGQIFSRHDCLLSERQGDDVGDLIINTIQTFLKDIAGNAIVAGIGISVPGIVNPATGRIWAPNIPGWSDYPLLERLNGSLGTGIPKVRIESDRTCYILGETWMGMAKGVQDAIYLSVGTGIGAGILSGGSVIRGQDGIAGAVGWMALSGKFRKDFSSCGNCEFQASGSGMVRLANQLVPAGSKHFKDAQALFSAFEQGHPIAKKVIREAVRTWGKSVANLVSVFNPSMIIFGGGIFGPAAQLLPEIKKEAFRWAQPISMSRVLIGISPLKGDAGLFGAGRLSFKEI